MTSIVGYSGFVGSNLCSEHSFDGLYDVKNISSAFGTSPDILVYCDVCSGKFLANNNPDNDMAKIAQAIEIIKRISPDEIILISTTDVYNNPADVYEDSEIVTSELLPYGLNRYRLERWVMTNFKKYLIVRLPKLYGINMKKNFIYDMINIIPAMLSPQKYKELSGRNPIIPKCYKLSGNGFYKCIELDLRKRNSLKECFENIGFTALNFTDSRGVFQYYNLKYLWQHIKTARKNEIKILNAVTEPVTAMQVYERVNGVKFKNEILKKFPVYNCKTRHSDIFSGNDGYIFDSEFVLNDIKNFVESYNDKSMKYF